MCIRDRQSSIWKRRLRNDPDYARDVLVSASVSQILVEKGVISLEEQYVDGTKIRCV